MATSSLNIKKLILVPAIISLVITLVRLIGELSDGLPLLFNKASGGAGALIGIAWQGEPYGYSTNKLPVVLSVQYPKRFKP